MSLTMPLRKQLSVGYLKNNKFDDAKSNEFREIITKMNESGNQEKLADKIKGDQIQLSITILFHFWVEIKHMT